MNKVLGVTTGLVVVLASASSAWADDRVAAADATDQTEAVVEETIDVAQTEMEADSEDGEEVSLTAEDEVEDEEEGSLIAPFSVSFSLSNTASLGAIFRDEFTVSNYDLLSFGFGLSYATPVPSLRTSLNWGFSKFLTESGGSTDQREIRVGDLRWGVGYGSIWSDPDNTGLNLSGNFGMRFPTSESSRFTNLRTAMSLGFGLSRSFGDLSLSLGISTSKNFHRDTGVVADLADYELDILARDGGTENIGEAQVAMETGVLSEWSLSNSFSVSYSFFPGFSASISFSFSNFWTYDNGTITLDDEFTSPNAVVGRGHGQGMGGSIGVSYAFLDYFGASLDLSTSQQPLTSDNSRVRFPFFDFETGNLQNTSLSLSLSASY